MGLDPNPDSPPHRWFGVRCVLRLEPEWFEERITLWSASSAESAIAQAEAEATEYAETVGAEVLGLAQSYEIPDAEIHAGSELFSLIRGSALEPADYLSRFFDTGTERQRNLGQ